MKALKLLIYFHRNFKGTSRNVGNKKRRVKLEVGITMNVLALFFYSVNSFFGEGENTPDLEKTY